jgi:predicted trehalose synthase
MTEKEESALEARIAAALAAGNIDERDAREIRRLAELEEEVKETSYEIDYDPSYTAHKVVD